MKYRVVFDHKNGSAAKDIEAETPQEAINKIREAAIASGYKNPQNFRAMF